MSLLRPRVSLLALALSASLGGLVAAPAALAAP